MNPAAKNGGKWKAWGELGYDVAEGREGAAADVTGQLRAGLASSQVVSWKDTPYGPRVKTWTPLRGPNGRTGSLVCAWQYDRGSDHPRMITNWLEVHREGRG
jgi:hypothetical protein